jgi:trk system potassium uptake protein TrkA
MYVIVVGAGQVGFHLAKSLITQQHEVTVVESDVATCDLLVDYFGDRVIPGSGARLRVLQQAGAERADVLVAATGRDEDNLVICQLARRLGTRRVIARVNNPHNVDIFHRLDVDLTVSASRLIAGIINQEVVSQQIRTLMSFPTGDLELVEVDLPLHTSLSMRLVRTLPLPEDTLLVTVIRSGHALVARGNVTVLPGDRLVVLTPPEQAAAVTQALLDPGDGKGPA